MDFQKVYIFWIIQKTTKLAPPVKTGGFFINNYYL